MTSSTSNRDQTIYGTDKGDSLNGGGGNDRIYGRSGNDRINGGDGNDYIEAGGGNDDVNGGNGNDWIEGGDGNDELKGGDGNDVLLGGSGNDELKGGDGDDWLDGGAGINDLDGNDGCDTFVFRLADHAGEATGSRAAYSEFDGDDDFDTLRLVLTRDEWLRGSVQSDVARFLAYLAQHTNRHGEVSGCDEFTFTAFNLKVEAIERLVIVVDGLVLDPRDEAVVARNDAIVATEDTASLSFNLLANDAVPDLVRSVSVGNPAKGSVTLVQNYADPANPIANVVYTPSATAFQYLALGEKAYDSFTYTVTDADGDVSTATVTITVLGQNDGPTILSGRINGAVTEDAAASLADAGTIVFQDLDLTDSHTVAIGAARTSVTSAIPGGFVPAGGFGVLTARVVENTADQNNQGQIAWSFAADNAQVQKLAQGQVATQVYTLTLTDKNGASVTQDVTVTLTGVNDGPTIVAADAAGATREDGTTAAAGDIAFADVDLIDAHSVSFTAQGSGYRGAFTAAIGDPATGDGRGNVRWTFAIDNAAIQDLAEGEVLTQRYAVAVRDNTGAIVTQVVTVTVTGANDAPVITSTIAAASGAVSEAGLVDGGDVAFAGTSNAGGQLSSTDVDNGATASWSGTRTGTYGEFRIDAATGRWTYVLDDARAATQALKAGETVTDRFLATVADDKGATATQWVVVTVTGSNDGPVVTSNAAAAHGAVKEAGVAQGGNLADAGMPVAGGRLTSSDVDHGATASWSGSQDGTYGAFAIAADGGWTYTLGNARAATQALAAGETRTERFTATVTDDRGATATQVVTVTVTGTNDAPTITSAEGAAAGSVVEAGVAAGNAALAGTPATGGQLSATDVDQAATAVWSGSTDGTYGRFAIDPATGAWTYLLDNARPSTQALGLGAVVTDRFTATVTDEHGATATQVVTVTITGTNDAPIAVADVAAAVEDQPVIVGTLANDSDADAGAVLTYALDAPVAGLTVAADGSYRFDPENGAYQALARGETQTVVARYTVVDQHGASATATLTITVTGTNDAPVAVVDVAATPEDAPITGTVAANDYDVDHGAVLHWELVAPVAGLTMTADGGYVFDAGDAAYQMLAHGETRTVVASYAVTDDRGVTAYSALVIVLTGTNDAPVVTSTTTAAAGTVIESGSEDNGAIVVGIAIATGQLSSSDVDNGATASWSGAAAGRYGNFAIDASTGRWTYRLDDGAAATQALAEGQSVSETFVATVTDDHGATATQPVTVTIVGTNDAPVVTSTAAAATGAALEAGVAAPGFGAAGQLVSTDVDAGATATWSGSGEGSYGRFAIGTTGAWTYTPDNTRAATQALALGQVVTETFTATVTDEFGASASQVVTIMLTGSNDAPVVTSGDAAARGTVAEAGNTDAGAIVAGTPTTGGTLTSSDVDAGATRTWSGTADGTYGAFAIDAATGTWGYVLDNARTATQGLREGQSATETFTATVTDEHGATATKVVTVTVTGTNDSPVVTTTPTTGTVVEAGSLDNGAIVAGVPTATGQLTASDVDTLATATWSGNANGAYGSFAINAATGAWTYTLDNARAATQGLREGQSVVETFTARVTDDKGAIATQQVRVTVQGTNDAPTVTPGAVAGTITALPAAVAGTPVLFNVEQWTGFQSNDLASLRAHAAGRPADYTVQTDVIDFTDDPAGFSGQIAGSSRWPAAAAQNAVGTGGVNDTFFVRATTTFTVTAADTYTFRTFNDDGVFLLIDGVLVLADTGYHPEQAYDRALALQPGTHTLELFFFEGGGEASLELLVRKGTGAFGLLGNGGGGIGSPQAASGFVTFADVDTGDAPVASKSLVSMTATGGGAPFALTAEQQAGFADAFRISTPAGNGQSGTVNWSYPIGNGALAFLGAGDTVTAVFAITVTDRFGAATSQNVTVTLNGVNDAPIVTGALIGVADEGGSAVTLAALANSGDADRDTTLSIVDVGTLPAGVTYDAATASFTLNPADPAYQYLAAGQQLTISVAYGVWDGTATVPTRASWTITGTNDVPVVAGTVTGTLAEDASSTLSGLAAAIDVDRGAVLTVVPGTLPAGVSFDPVTNSFTLDASAAIFQSLAAGQQRVVTVDYDITDGTSPVPASASWTVIGTNDAPVVTGAVTATVAEDAARTLSAIGNASDVDQGTVLSVVGLPTTLPAGVTYNAAERAFTLNASNPAYQYLAPGETALVTVTYGVSDGVATTDASVSWTVTGTNDVPRIDLDVPAPTVNPTAIADLFTLNGSAARTGEANLVRLTPDATSQSGSAISIKKLDFSQSITFDFDVFVGFRDMPGADGVTMVLHNDPRGARATGGFGIGLGVSGIQNGLAIEFDTYQNAGEPFEDHTSFIRTGSFTSVSPVQTLGNIEDGRFHRVVVSWDAPTKTLSYTIDGVPRGTLTGDLVAQYFGGSDTVFFGFTGGTGGEGNLQQVRINAITGVLADAVSTNPTYVENAAPIAVTGTNVAIDDWNERDLTQLKVTIAGVRDGAAERLTLGDATFGLAADAGGSAVVGGEAFGYTYVAATGTLTVTATDGRIAPAALEMLIETLRYADAGEAPTAGTRSFAFQLTDASGAVSAVQTARIDVVPVNDAPVATPFANAGSEDGTIAGRLTATDVDNAAATLTFAQVGTPVSGLTINADGSYTLDARHADYQALTLGQSRVVTATYSVSDGAATVNSTLSITVYGVNEPPVAVADLGATTENAGVTGNVLANDTFTGSTGATGNILVNGSFEDGHPVNPGEVRGYASLPGWTAPNGFEVWGTGFGGNAAADGIAFVELDNGAAQDAYSQVLATEAGRTYYLAFDLAQRAGTSPATNQVEFLVNGRSIGVFTPTTTAFATFNVQFVGTGSDTITFREPAAASDGLGGLIDNLRIAAQADVFVTAVGGSAGGVGGAVAGSNGGSFTVAANGSYTFTPGTAFDHLAAGQTATTSVTYTMADNAGSSSSTLTVTVTGTNDAPVVTSTAIAASGTVVEAGSADNGLPLAGVPSVSGTLTASDVDAGATRSWSATGTAGTYGTFAISEAGVWTYTLDNARAATQGLREGQVVTETFTARVTDDKGAIADQAVTVRVTGTNDAPTLTGVASPVTFAENTVNATPQFIDTAVSFGDVDGNLGLGRLVVSGLRAEDRVSIGGHGPIAVSGSSVSYNGTVIGTMSGGVGATLTVQFTDAATPVATQALIQSLTYANVSDAPSAQRTLVINVVDAAGGQIAASFGEQTGANNPFAAYQTQRSVASFADIDGDGDLDMVVGSASSGLAAFRNTGNGTFTQLTGSANPFAAIGTPTLSTAAFADLNGDGRSDLLLGTDNRPLRTFVQGADGSFGEVSGAANPFNGVNGGYDAAPTFADIDGDGDKDMVLGSFGGTFRVFRNNGSNGFIEQFGAANPLNGFSTGTHSKPAAVDFDGDGDLDIVSGSWTQGLLSYRNNGNGTFTQLTGTDNPYAGVNTAMGAAPSFADLNGDGVGDAVMGSDAGTLRLFTSANGAQVVVNVTAQNDAPVLATALFDQAGLVDAPFSYTVPAGSFTDVDSTLSYSARLASGATLPSWLSFNSATRTFSGTPGLAHQGSIDVVVTASDGALMVADTVRLTVNPNVLTGTSVGDTLNGTTRSETIVGNGGNDVLNGGGGNDTIYGDALGEQGPSANAPSTLSAVAQSYYRGDNSLRTGLGGASGFGEGEMHRNDDEFSPLLDLTSVFGSQGINFFGRNYTTVSVNNNGNLTFGQQYGSFTPSPIAPTGLPPLIAAFWTDIDTRAGAVVASQGGTSTGSNLVYWDLDTTNRVLTATWDDVGQYSYGTTPNAFQIQLVDRGAGDFDIIFRYETIQWNYSGARAGYSGGGTAYELPDSVDRTELNLDADPGNTGIAGLYVFQVRGGQVSTSSNDTINGGAGADTLIGGEGADIFVFQAGEGNGDTILDFNGSGSGPGDSLKFLGYGAGATFTQVGTSNQWTISSADGAIHDVITFANGATIDPTDFTFG